MPSEAPGGGVVCVTMGEAGEGTDVTNDVVGRPLPDDVYPDAPVQDNDPFPAEEFDAFVAATGDRLLRTAYLLTGDERTAEDLVQDTLLRVWSHWSRVRQADAPVAYARRVLVNTSVSRWRRLAVRPERLVADLPDRATTDAGPRDHALWTAVVALPPRQRAVVVLAYYEDLSDGQVAEALGTSVGTVKSQRAKALRKLRAHLVEEDR
jgi:RNA polymerase sigma-70 factor (sigma-E family)